MGYWSVIAASSRYRRSVWVPIGERACSQRGVISKYFFAARYCFLYYPDSSCRSSHFKVIGVKTDADVVTGWFVEVPSPEHLVLVDRSEMNQSEVSSVPN